jgi:D-alanyl-D-alanine carboxypeptidase/D-alanyl-D-alanine-endopeptidase (penicillin-binding protein 4)
MVFGRIKSEPSAKAKVCLFLLLVLVCLSANTLSAEPAGQKLNINKLVHQGSYALSRDGHILTSFNEDIPFVPASIIKLATAVAALEIMGPQYRFETRFYVDDTTLFIKGFGDPFLISEEVEGIVNRLRERGLSRVSRIVVDQGAFLLQTPAQGSSDTDNPYDARNSGLAVNFNTVNIVVDEDGRVESAEPQTPTLPVMKILAQGISAGVYRRNIVVGGDDSLSWKYAGQLFQAFMQQQGIADRVIIKAGRVADGNEPFFTFYSRPLTEMIGPLMRYSNNFIANQIFLACGARKYGFPATWEKGKKAVAEFFKQTYNLDTESFTMVEGSGLSRRNRVTARSMLVVLEAFKPYVQLLPQINNVYVKSGTLTGVYSYAGYFPAKGKMDSVVLILNQQQNTRHALLKELQRVSQSTELR